MARNKVVYKGTVLVDLTADTVQADKLMNGITAHDASGAKITGTASISYDSTNELILLPDGLVELITG